MDHIIKELTSIQETSKKQGDNLVAATKAMESVASQTQILIDYVKTLNVPCKERKETLHMLYAITRTVTNTMTDIRFNY